MTPTFEFAQNELNALRKHIEAVEQFLNHSRATDILTRIEIGELSDDLDNIIRALDAYEQQLEQRHKP